MRPAPLAALVAALLLAPLAQGGMDVEMAFSGDFATLRMTTEVGFDGEGAQRVRGNIDGNGDRDGQVSQGEVDRFAALAMQRSGGDVELGGLSDGNLTLDGRPPTGLRLAGMRFEGAIGPAASQAPLTMAVETHLTFVPGAGRTHTLFMGGSGPEDGLEGKLILRAPSGYAIRSATGLPGSTLDGARDTLTAPAGDVRDATVVFARSGLFAPAGAAAPLALALLAAALLGRRRHR